MNYAAFKTHLATFLWKQNDTDLVASLDSLIRMANSELNRVLNIQRRNKTVIIQPDTEDYMLPADFRHMIALTNMDYAHVGVMTNSLPSSVYVRRSRTSSGTPSTEYAVDQGATGKVLLLCGPYTPTNKGNFMLQYRANVPDFQLTDASWVEEDFLDLYTYAVLSHTAPFLREDERLQMWEAMKVEAITGAEMEDKHEVTWGGSPLAMKPHHPVP